MSKKNALGPSRPPAVDAALVRFVDSLSSGNDSDYTPNEIYENLSRIRRLLTWALAAQDVHLEADAPEPHPEQAQGSPRPAGSPAAAPSDPTAEAQAEDEPAQADLFENALEPEEDPAGQDSTCPFCRGSGGGPAEQGCHHCKGTGHRKPRETTEAENERLARQEDAEEIPW